MSKCGNPTLTTNPELEKALVRMKAKCPEEADLLCQWLETTAQKIADDATLAAGGVGTWEVSRFLLGGYRMARTVREAIMDADGLEPEEGAKPKYDRSIDQ